MSPLTGTSGGQDYRRNAALKIATGGQAPQPSPDAGAATPFAKRLLDMAIETVRDRENFKDNIAGWRQALMFLGQNMPQGQGPPAMAAGSTPGGPPPTGEPSMMGEMGAQAAPGMYGRPPR